ncbi:hypothetical protein HK103_001004 [Boothiomyces macroporosus]|uniref:VWFD domain-containing protein n=1 Tax=Boothiomyces macroporosus TaxID=261099 RepID=A0AAD5UBB6_9FUNG|nr:hypothetical protein HK103_001004 [Boothiomyces macroporosus]
MLFNAAALLTFTAAATVPLVDVDPSSLYINDLGSNYIRVRLTKQPVANTNVYFSASALVFGQCSTTFTPQNWNQYQSIPVRGVPQFANMANQTYTVKARSFGFTGYSNANSKAPTVYPKIDSTFTITRKVSPGGLCSSTGDPHFNTFDNQLFSRQTGAVTRLFQNQDLEVQAWQVLCRKGGIYCNQAVAVRYGSSVFVIDNRQNITESMQMKQLTNNVDGVIYQAPANLYSGTHNLYIPDGSKVSISNTVYNKGLPDIHQYMGVQLTVPAQSGAYNGVCNRISTTKLPSFYLQDGTTVSATAANVNYFVDSCAVVSEKNIFNGNFKTTTPAWRKAFTCALPGTDTLPVVPTPPTLPSYVQVAVPPMYDNTPKFYPSPDFIIKAIDFCTSVLNTSTCVHVLDPSPYIKGCANDASLTGTQGLAEHHKQAYLQDCYSVTNNLQAVSDSDKVNKAVQVQDSLGLGDSHCPNNCNKVGTCTAIGCDCGQSGFTGVACEIQIKNFAPVAYTSSSAASSSSRVTSSSTTKIASSVAPSTTKVTLSAAASTGKAVSTSEAVYIQATTTVAYKTSSAASTPTTSSPANNANSKAAGQEKSNNAQEKSSNAPASASSSSSHQSAATPSLSGYHTFSSEGGFEKTTSQASHAAPSQPPNDADQQAAHILTLAAYENSVLAAIAATAKGAVPTPPAFIPTRPIRYPQCKAQQKLSVFH